MKNEISVLLVCVTVMIVAIIAGSVYRDVQLAGIAADKEVNMEYSKLLNEPIYPDD